MILGGLLFPIFQTYTLNYLVLEAQLNEFIIGMIFLIGALLSRIVMLIYAELVLYYLYLIISSIWGEKGSPGSEDVLV